VLRVRLQSGPAEQACDALSKLSSLEIPHPIKLAPAIVMHKKAMMVVFIALFIRNIPEVKIYRSPYAKATEDILRFVYREKFMINAFP